MLSSMFRFRRYIKFFVASLALVLTISVGCYVIFDIAFSKTSAQDLGPAIPGYQSGQTQLEDQVTGVSAGGVQSVTGAPSVPIGQTGQSPLEGVSQPMPQSDESNAPPAASGTIEESSAAAPMHQTGQIPVESPSTIVRSSPPSPVVVNALPVEQNVQAPVVVQPEVSAPVVVQPQVQAPVIAQPVVEQPNIIAPPPIIVQPPLQQPPPVVVQPPQIIHPPVIVQSPPSTPSQIIVHPPAAPNISNTNTNTNNNNSSATAVSGYTSQLVPVNVQLPKYDDVRTISENVELVVDQPLEPVTIVKTGGIVTPPQLPKTGLPIAALLLAGLLPLGLKLRKFGNHGMDGYSEPTVFWQRRQFQKE